MIAPFSYLPIAFPHSNRYLNSMRPAIVVHHHEITLKGENRRLFERQLMKNVRNSLSGMVPASAIHGGYGRFIIELSGDEAASSVEGRLGTLFGISNICTGLRVEQNLGQMCTAAETLLEGREFNTLKVNARRPDKNFPIGSMEINEQVGAYLCKRFNVRANLSQPDETVYVEVVDGVAYVYRSKLPGAGGLPSGVSGRVVALLSAGFDSPVAAWQMMKRGASVIFVHFHSLPYTSLRSIEQVRQIVTALTRYQLRSKLYLIPFAEIQNEIVLRAPQSLRVILYRRMMVRIAEDIARRERAEALATGESVGQVASQTLRNIRVIDEAASLPILRPLSGSDKEEIIKISRNIGTFDISSQPYDDCCSYLAPRNPETWSVASEVTAAETNLDLEAFICQAREKAALESFVFPEVREENLVESPAG